MTESPAIRPQATYGLRSAGPRELHVSVLAVSRKSHMLRHSVLPPDLVTRMKTFAQGVLHEKLVTQAKDMCIAGPMTNKPRAEVLLNTKIAVQYSMDRHDCSSMTRIRRRCAGCRGTNEEEEGSRGTCCPMGSKGCAECVGRPYVCPEEGCGLEYVRRWAYETGSGRGSIGRNPAQFKVLPFTREMHDMADVWAREGGGTYNNIVLVTYCGADMCAHCACGLEHGSIQCASILRLHQDNAQGGNGRNSQEECSINRTLNIGSTRVLTMALARHLGGGYVQHIPGTEYGFEMRHGSEFVLDTRDEVGAMRDTDHGPVQSSWTHGMVTPVSDGGISCGFVGRTVKNVRDVRIHDDVVIDTRFEHWCTSTRAAEFGDAAREWHAMYPAYVQRVGPKVLAALAAWDGCVRRSSRNTGS
jgi:hypothetical protein